MKIHYSSLDRRNKPSDTDMGPLWSLLMLSVPVQSLPGFHRVSSAKICIGPDNSDDCCQDLVKDPALDIFFLVFPALHTRLRLHRPTALAYVPPGPRPVQSINAECGITNMKGMYSVHNGLTGCSAICEDTRDEMYVEGWPGDTSFLFDEAGLNRQQKNRLKDSRSWRHYPEFWFICPIKATAKREEMNNLRLGFEGQKRFRAICVYWDDDHSMQLEASGSREGHGLVETGQRASEISTICIDSAEPTEIVEGVDTVLSSDIEHDPAMYWTFEDAVAIDIGWSE